MTIQNTNLETVAKVTVVMNETKIAVRKQLSLDFAAKLSEKLKSLKGVSLLG